MADTLIKALTALGFTGEALIVMLALELSYGWLKDLELAVVGTLIFAIVAASSIYGWIVANAWIAGDRAPLPSMDWLFSISLPQIRSEPQMSAQARYQATIERLSQSQIKWVAKEGSK